MSKDQLPRRSGQLLFLCMMTNFHYAALMACVLLGSCGKSNKLPPAEQVQQQLMLQVDSLQHHLAALAADAKRRDYQQVQAHFRRARLVYKKMEPIVEFYFAGASKAINGPAIDEADEHDDKVNYATGFQVVEEYLFPAVDTTQAEELARECAVLESCGVRVRSLLKGTELTDGNIFQAVRLQVLRIMSLGITGFDSPVAFASLGECDASLEGIVNLLAPYAEMPSSAWSNTTAIVKQARDYLHRNPDFDRFDRATFIRRHLNPLSRSLHHFQREKGVSDNPWVDAVDMRKEDFFAPDVFQSAFFTQPGKARTAEIVALGKVLFFDPILSGNNKRACASCHQPELAFTDGKPRSVAFNLQGSLERNAPTLINAAFQRSQFWDQRVTFVEDQVSDVVGNLDEMHHSLEGAARLISKSEEYRTLFATAFGQNKDDSVTAAMIRRSLASYVQSLHSFNSKFDRYMRDTTQMLSASEINGFNLFMGKAKCATCHFMPLFNGSVPPMYAETESEVLGVPERPDTTRARVDPDLGKFHTYPRELFKHAFKTPSVRNVALTAPYMHNGVYATLEQVMDFYNRGGGAGIGIDLPNQTLPPDPLHLSVAEQRDIISFLHTLTDTTALTGKPVRLPRLHDNALDKRSIAGEY